MEARRRSIRLAVLAAALGVATPGAAPRTAGGPVVQITAIARAPVAIVVLPALRRVAVVGHAGTLDTFDLSLHPLASFSVCAEPRWLAADHRHGRILVGCHDAKVQPGDDRGDLVVVDVRARTVVARLPGIATLSGAGVDPSPGGLVYVRLIGGRVARFDSAAGRVVDTIVLDGAAGDRLRFVAGNARTPMIALDRDADRVFAIRRDGTALAVAVGRRRAPADAALDGQHLAVALAGAGTVDVIDLGRPDDHHVLPSIDEPMAVAFDRAGQVVAVGRQARDSADLAAVALNERGAARMLGTIPRTQYDPYPFDTTQTARDPATGRLVVATAHRIAVVDTGPGWFSVDLLPDMTVAGLALDTATGDAYVAMSGDAPGGAIARVPVRGKRPQNPAAKRGRVFSIGEGVHGFVFALAEPDDSRPGADPPGLRSPAEIAVRSDGALTVADVLSPTLGTFAHGSYHEDRVASQAAPRALAHDRDGTLWFSESTRKRGVIARRNGDGTLTEFALPARADKIVVADDGLYWLARYPGNVFGRIARDGTVAVRTVTLPGSDLGERGLVDVAPAPGGGCYVLYTDKFVRVHPDGTTEIYPDAPAGMGFGRISALAALPDGAVAFAVDHVVVRQERTGARHLYWPLPREAPLSRASSYCRISELTGRSDGSVWGVCGERIFGVTKSGLARAVVPPAPQSDPQSLVEAPDGAMWFAEPAHSALGRIAPDGTLTEFSL